MKITRIKLYPVLIPRHTGILNQHVILRLDTDNDYTGWGEMSDLSHLPLFQMDMAILEQSLNDLLNGKDPRNIAQIEQLMDRYYPFEGHKYSRSGLVREGIDLALHDLLGRVNNVSVSALLGGAIRDRFKVCYPIFRMRSEAEIGPNLERIQQMLDQGFDLIRVYVGANVEADALFLEQFASRFGETVKIKSLDFSNLLDWRRSLAATERFAQFADPMLIESVALDDDYEGMIEFRRRSRWPISEHVHHLHHAWTLVSRGCLDILNVSPYVIGGIRACLRVIALAESSRTSVLIGTTQELNLGTAAVAHLGAMARVLDYPSDNTGPELYTADVVKTPLKYENGHLLVPDGPGLGVEVDEDLLSQRTTTITSPFGTNLVGLLDRTAPNGGKTL
jgi:L-alanine-DL-glutamate epimerase-like enolase superfamily enzyme